MAALFFGQQKQNEAYHRVHHVAVHDYHDHSTAKDEGSPEPIARGGVTTPFPIKLHEMLDKIERDGYGDVVSWQPHGRCFVVHKPKEFVNHVMPTYFKQSKFPSFQRQLNLYGFQRLTKGPDKGGYYHELFLRSKLFLAYRIQRMRVKGTGVRARSNPEMEPNFSKMAEVLPTSNAENDVSPLETPSSSLLVPEEVLSSVNNKPESELGDFEGMHFHLLDPTDYEQRRPLDELFSTEDLESFLDQLNISRDLYQDIVSTVDDDLSFGDLLQRVME